MDTLTTSRCPDATAKCIGHQLVFSALFTPPGPNFLLTGTVIDDSRSAKELWLEKKISLQILLLVVLKM